MLNGDKQDCGSFDKNVETLLSSKRHQSNHIINYVYNLHVKVLYFFSGSTNADARTSREHGKTKKEKRSEEHRRER